MTIKERHGETAFRGWEGFYVCKSFMTALDHNRNRIFKITKEVLSWGRNARIFGFKRMHHVFMLQSETPD